MAIVNPAVEGYINGLRGTVHPVMAEMEALARELDFPIIGPQVGQVLEVLARAVGARRVLELGSGFGYSAFWFAQSIGETAEIHCTDADPAHRDRALDYFERAGFTDRVHYHVGDALSIAATLERPFDIVLNDVDKELYPQTIELALSALRPGGLFITDNVLWKERVLAPEEGDEPTRGVIEFNRRLQAHPGLRVAILPIRDGVALAVKV